MVHLEKQCKCDIPATLAIVHSFQVIPTRDRQEGMAAFLEKRKPNYTGE